MDQDMNPTGVFDNPHYAAIAVANHEAYTAQAPFPHIVLDDFLPRPLATNLSRAFPSPGDGTGWVVNDHQNALKRYVHDETLMPSLLRAMLREFNSKQFVLFLEALTGIESLIPDPFFIGGGLHFTGPGGYLNMHADFNWLHKLQLHRRVNALLYLTEDWQQEWGGELEFSDEQRAACVKVPPHFNRLVVFSTSEHSFHGQPQPLRTPEGVFRKALNVYYYTSKWDAEDGHVDPHFTKYLPQASPVAQEISNSYSRSARGHSEAE